MREEGSLHPGYAFHGSWRGDRIKAGRGAARASGARCDGDNRLELPAIREGGRRGDDPQQRPDQIIRQLQPTLAVQRLIHPLLPLCQQPRPQRPHFLPASGARVPGQDQEDPHHAGHHRGAQEEAGGVEGAEPRLVKRGKVLAETEERVVGEEAEFARAEEGAGLCDLLQVFCQPAASFVVAVRE